jgi:Ca2+/Na+ antiporter
MSLIAILLSIALIVYWIARRRSEEDDDEKERNAYIARTLTIIFGILTPIVFLILDDMRLPMVWINKWTPYVGLVFLIHIALFLFYKFRNKEKDPNESEQGP